MTALKSKIKNTLKQTFLYAIIKSIRARNRGSTWTAHDQASAEFYSQFISPGSLVFDVGANIGNRVKIFLKLQAKVVAVEPQDECAKELRTAYGRNQRLTIIQQALGEAIGEAEIMISDASVLSSLSPEWIAAVSNSGRFPGCTWKNKKTIQMTTLDHLIEQHGEPTFIKIDVEGYEYQVLRGLSRPVNVISLEFAPGASQFLAGPFPARQGDRE